MTNTTFRNVALLAATGNLGSKILRNLTSAGFNVTAIQRKDSSKSPPDGVKSVKVDLMAKSELVSAFRGQDVVISAVPSPQLSAEKVMIDAAVEAGVKRIVPSEFSSNLEGKARDENFPNIAEKLRIRKYVEEVAATGSIEWSSINNGVFFDLGITYGFLGPNVRNKKATFHDGGDIGTCTTSTEDIAKAVVAILQHPEETRNRPNYVYSALITERQITKVVSKLTGIDFAIDKVDIHQQAKEYFDAVANGEASPAQQFALYFVMMYGKGYGGDYRDIAMNEKLGLRVMNDEEIEQSVKQWLEKAGALKVQS